eukprot:gene19333-biopygen22029
MAQAWRGLRAFFFWAAGGAGDGSAPQLRYTVRVRGIRGGRALREGLCPAGLPPDHPKMRFARVTTCVRPGPVQARVHLSAITG